MFARFAYIFLVCLLVGCVTVTDSPVDSGFDRHKAAEARISLGLSYLESQDMVKAREIMEDAYNDSKGITAEFNRNILNVLNKELNADFDPSHFDHVAFFNEDHGRIEMHLRANRDISVKLKSINLETTLKKGETIHTENSRKFTREGIEDLASRGGLSIQKWYSDPSEWFSLVLMVPDSQRNG